MLDNVVMLQSRPSIRLAPAIGDMLDAVLDDALELLRPAVDRQANNVSLEHIADEIRQGQSVLWLVYLGGEMKAALTTCVVKHEKRATLKIEFMGGAHMAYWMDYVVSQLAGLAKTAGLSAIEADGRKGFEKFVGNSAFRPVYTHYEMELS